MNDANATARPLVRRADDVEAEPVDAADGLSKALLIGETQGAPNLAIRRFTLAPGAEVPRHINENWYRNERDEEGEFICAVPTGDDSIEIVEE